MRIHTHAWSLVALVTLTSFVAACNGGGGDDDDDDDGSPPTYWADIKPILNEECIGCHVGGGIAPFALSTYGSASTFGFSIRSATQTRYMPPSTIDNSGACNTWTDARWLTDAEITTIDEWVAAGFPEGNPADAPPAPTPLPTLTEVNETIDTAFDYTPPASADEYRCFVVNRDGEAASFLTAYEVQPGNAEIVHHVVLFMPASQADEDAADALDTGDAGPGYQCFGASGVDASILSVWAPGTGATFFPAGTGIQIPANRNLVIQVHYNTLGSVGGDPFTAIDLDLETTVGQQAAILPFGAALGSFTIPPGETAYEVVRTATVPIGGTVHAIYPHMHTHGRLLLVEQIRGATTSCVANVDRWNFGWQQFFTATTPIELQSGDEIRVTCTFDTQGETDPITSGENTDQEMCGIGVYATL